MNQKCGLPILFALCLTAPAVAETRLEVGPGVCDHLVNYVEPPGVEYQPGVDANGNPVESADVGGTKPLKMPTKFTIPITDYLYGQLAASSGVATQPANGVLSPQLLVGVVTYDNGQLSFNGQPLGGDPDGALGQLCRKARGQ